MKPLTPRLDVAGVVLSDYPAPRPGLYVPNTPFPASLLQQACNGFYTNKHIVGKIGLCHSYKEVPGRGGTILSSLYLGGHSQEQVQSRHSLWIYPPGMSVDCKTGTRDPTSLHSYATMYDLIPVIMHGCVHGPLTDI